MVNLTERPTLMAASSLLVHSSRTCLVGEAERLAEVNRLRAVASSGLTTGLLTLSVEALPEGKKNGQPALRERK